EVFMASLRGEVSPQESAYRSHAPFRTHAHRPVTIAMNRSETSSGRSESAVSETKETSTATVWLLTLLFFPAASMGALLCLVSYVSRPVFAPLILSLYFAHRLLFASAMIGLSLRQLRE